MTETTSELGKGVEGPGHGVWEGQGDEYTGTFELFLFSDSGEYAGTARVRIEIRLDSPDHISGQAAVDLMALDGSLQANIDVSPFEGTRVKVRPLEMD
jgi:hypothetical protein